MLRSAAGVLALLVSAAPALAQVRILYQNDLTTNATASALLILDDSTVGSAASAACERYNEKLLTTVTPDIQDQIRYLVFRGQLDNGSAIYVQGSSSNTTALRFARRQQTTCSAYRAGSSDNVTTVDCSTRAPVLCTNSAAPYVANATSSSTTYENTASDRTNSFLGYRDARSFRFLGIPFAAPPVGDLRFSSAQPYTGTYSNFSALASGKPCIQTPSAFGIANANDTSEDCLTLNIFTPTLPSGSSTSNSLPVAFWIYGGAFTEGAGSLPDYDGGNMASRGDVVVVTINYRVGPLGNMASAALNGSQGITDQIQALRWVQNHISVFGGDPSKVTIFGQSAGAQSVVALLSSTPAKGLFSAAISESAPWNPFPNRAVYTDAIYPTLLNSTNCTSSDSATQLSCLRALPADAFIGANLTNAITAAAMQGFTAYAQVGLTTSGVEPLLPVVGTGVIDGLAVDLIQKGSLPSAGIPLMIGNVENEGILFVDNTPGLLSPLPASQAILNFVLPNAFDNATTTAILANPTLFAFNQTDPDALRDLASQLVTLYNWQCPLQQVLGFAAQRKTFTGLYSYRFDKGFPQTAALPAECKPNNISGIDHVCHSEDIPEVFGNSDVLGTPFNETNSLPFTQYVQDTWTSFIRTGSPAINAAYVTARGRSYENSLTLAQEAPFDAFSANSGTAIHIMDLPPRNSAILYPQQCQVLADSGFFYDNIASSNGTMSMSVEQLSVLADFVRRSRYGR